jgi:hypothetical protein
MESNEMGRVCITYGERRGAYKVLVERLREGDHLEDPGSKWENNIETDLSEAGMRGRTGSICLGIG